MNDDVLFGEIWSREEQLSSRDRSMITIAALFAAGQYPQLKSHLVLGKEHGITKEEAVEMITQLAFYCGWPKAYSSCKKWRWTDPRMRCRTWLLSGGGQGSNRDETGRLY